MRSLSILACLLWAFSGPLAKADTEASMVPAHTECGEPLECLIKADLKWARSAQSGDGAAMVSALEDLVALEASLLLPNGQPTALTTPDQFTMAAQAISHRPELIARLIALRPVRYRGGTSSSKTQLAVFEDGRSTPVVLEFEANDRAIIYVRGGAPGAINLIVKDRISDGLICDSYVESGWPYCVWTPTEKQEYVAELVLKNDVAEDVRIMTN